MSLHIGRHCCLWCNITYDQLKIDQETRKSSHSIAPRSLASLDQKYSEFVLNGSNLKRAKFYDNVIGKAFFDVPLSQVSLASLVLFIMAVFLSQVCPPGLHITLGIFQRLFNLLEEECHSLDCSLSENCDTASNSFATYLVSKTAITSLEHEISKLQSEVNHAQQILALLLLTTTDPQRNPSVQGVVSLIHTNTIKIRDNVIITITIELLPITLL